METRLLRLLRYLLFFPPDVSSGYFTDRVTIFSTPDPGTASCCPFFLPTGPCFPTNSSLVRPLSSDDRDPDSSEVPNGSDLPSHIFW